MNVIDWLLDSDPALRWQVKRDLLATDAAPDRAEIEHAGWSARLLSLADENGLWAGGACFPGGWDFTDESPGQPWTATMHTLQTLQILGLDPSCPSARRAICLVAANGRWEYDNLPYFGGEVEPCINGRTIETGAYFGMNVNPLVARLVSEQLPDGGWNCEESPHASFDTTLCVLDGLLAFPAAAETRRRGEEYLLSRGLFRRRRDGAVIKPEYLDFAFPYYWHYDVLRALDYFRRAGAPPDPRLNEAVEVVRSKRRPEGWWLLDRVHPGQVWFDFEQPGQPSRWNTLRALRILQWWEKG
ncbi:hypothetical protein AB0M02_22465 [Actinoplanes sp. NPDC051861]|uniref:hypothetical protein n=1 Tax=Actinoplanes sp. NPDC051861 TaxID=3155170 RepID=UPI00343B469A